MKLRYTQMALAAALVAVQMIPSTSWAQMSPADAERLLRLEQERLRGEQERSTRERAPSGVDLKSLVPKPEQVTTGGTCHDIRSIDLKGADLLDDQDKQGLLAPFAGKCFDAGRIQALMGAVTQHYIERGFTTTRAYLPAQDLASGQLQILVQEGRIESFKIEGGPSARLNLRWAVPAVPGDLLNIRQLEQAVDQLNSVPGNKVKMDIVPGSVPGKSVVVFRNEASTPLNLQVSADNHGSDATGVNGVSANLAVGGLLGLNDTLSVTVRQSSPHTSEASSDSASVGLSLPDGFATYGFSMAQSKFSTGMRLPSGTHLVTYGDSTTYTLTAERTVFRDQDSRYTAVAALSQVEGDTRTVNDDGLAIMKTNRLARTLGAGLKVTNTVNGGSLYLRPELSFGLVPTLNTVSDGPQGEFTKFTLDMNYEKRFDGMGQQWGWSSNFKGQYSQDQLLSSQQILLGSMASVRGFVKNAMSGDSGYYWRNELAWHNQLQLAGLSTKNKLFAGFDFGRISNNNPDPLLPRGSMTGYVVGLTSQIEKMSLDLFWTKAHSLPSTMKIESPQTWVRVSYSL